MESSTHFEERRKHPRISIGLPLEYWRTDDVCRGGMVGNMSEGGLLIHSLQDVRVGEELNVRIFFPNGYELDGIKVMARIVWKDLHYETDWKGYKYGVEIVKISEEDRQKLVGVLRDPPALEGITAIGEQSAPSSPLQERPVVPPLSTLDPGQAKGDSRTCLWERFKMKILHPW